MLKAFNILLFLFISISSFGQFWKKDKPKEETLIEGAKEDFQALLSQKQYPYIEKFHNAVRERQRGNLTEAKKLFEECIDNYPHQDAVYYGLALIAKEKNLNTEALTYFKKAHDFDSQNISFIQEIAFLSLEKGDYELADKYFEILVKKEPRNAEWLYAFAQLQIYKRDYKRAVEILDNIEDLMGQIPDITRMKADLYRELKDLEGAEKELLALKKSFPDDLEVLKDIIGFYEQTEQEEKAFILIKELAVAEPDNSIAHFILAKNYAASKQYDEYLKSLKVAVAGSEIKIEDKIQLMQLAFTLEDPYFDSLVPITEIMTEVHPSSAKAFAIHAEVLNVMGQAESTLNFYRKALELDDSEYRLWTSVLALESAYKAYEFLYQDGKKAIELFPTLPFVYFAAAEGAIHLEKFDEAADFLDQGEIYIVDDNVQKAKFLMRRGELNFVNGNSKAGIELFEAAIDFAPKTLKIQESYAYHLARYGKDAKKAEKLLKKLLNEKDLITETVYVVAYVYASLKQYEKALNFIDNKINELHYNAEITDLKGDVLYWMNDIENALAFWNLAIERNSRNIKLMNKIEEKTYYAPVYL